MKSIEVVISGIAVVKFPFVPSIVVDANSVVIVELSVVVFVVVIIEAAEVSMTDVAFFVLVVAFDVVRFSVSSIVADDEK